MLAERDNNSGFLSNQNKKDRCDQMKPLRFHSGPESSGFLSLGLHLTCINHAHCNGQTVRTRYWTKTPSVCRQSQGNIAIQVPSPTTLKSTRIKSSRFPSLFLFSRYVGLAMARARDVAHVGLRSIIPKTGRAYLAFTTARLQFLHTVPPVSALSKTQDATVLQIEQKKPAQHPT